MEIIYKHSHTASFVIGRSQQRKSVIIAMHDWKLCNLAKKGQNALEQLSLYLQCALVFCQYFQWRTSSMGVPNSSLACQSNQPILFAALCAIRANLARLFVFLVLEAVKCVVPFSFTRRCAVKWHSDWIKVRSRANQILKSKWSALHNTEEPELLYYKMIGWWKVGVT